MFRCVCEREKRERDRDRDREREQISKRLPRGRFTFNRVLLRLFLERYKLFRILPWDIHLQISIFFPPIYSESIKNIRECAKKVSILWSSHCIVFLREKGECISSARSFYDPNFLIDTYIVMNILQCQRLNVIYITISLT